MTNEEKEKYHIEGIATLFKNVMFGMALVIGIGYLASKYFENNNLQNIFFFISLLIGIPYLLLQSNAKKYKK